MTGNTIARSSELILLDNISAVNGNHNGGDLEVGNDGFLYVAVGDAGCDPRGDSGCAGSNDGAQDLSLLNGKILRVDRATGAPAAGNPFALAGAAPCRTRGNTPSTPVTSGPGELHARNPSPVAGTHALLIALTGRNTFWKAVKGKLPETKPPQTYQ